MNISRCHDLPKRTERGRNGPEQTKKRTGIDRNGMRKIPKQTSRSTETGFDKDRVGQDRAGHGRARQGTAGLGWYLPTYLSRVRVPLYLPSAYLLCFFDLPTHPLASSNQSTIYITITYLPSNLPTHIQTYLPTYTYLPFYLLNSPSLPYITLYIVIPTYLP